MKTDQNNDQKLKDWENDVEVGMEVLKDDFGTLARVKIKNLKIKNLYVTINNYPAGFLDDVTADKAEGDENIG